MQLIGRLLAAASMFVAAPALGQAAGADGRILYDAAFFQTFAPANALQIVQRTPGFNLEIAEEEVRGFAQAAGNVVINGERPSSKSDTLDVILSRIPASRVLRVEIGRGDLFGAEFAGKSQVLNLVLTNASGLAGTLEASLRREYTGKLLPEGSASMLLRRGESTFNLSVAFDNEQTGEIGYDRLISLPSRDEIEYRAKINSIRDPNGNAAASWAYNGGENRTAHLNGRIAFDRFQLTQANDVFPTLGAIRDDRLTQRYDLDEFEIGGDVTRPFAGGGLKLIGLITRRNRTQADVSLNRIDSAVIGGFTQTLVDDRDESLVRLVWSRQNLAGWNVEMGAEGVLNRLISKVDLFALDETGAGTRIDLPVDDAVVTEYRGEAFINAGRALTPKLRIDAGLTVETSKLTVRGDTKADRALTFPKPRVTLDWQPGNDWRLQLSLQRTVAQLQFEEFISAAELANERVNGGNAELLPQRAWELLATAQRPILKTGLIKLELGYNRISLVQDRIPTPEGFDAPGNLGNGRSLIARLTADAPLDRFGIKGGRVNVYISYVGTAVQDPYTLRDRAFSNNSPLYAEASFRQDLGKFAYGVNLEGSTASTGFRRDELDRLIRAVPIVSAFAEYRPTPRTTITAGLDNLTDVGATRERTFFAPDRTSDTPVLREFRIRTPHVTPYLTLKHSFG